MSSPAPSVSTPPPSAQASSGLTLSPGERARIAMEAIMNESDDEDRDLPRSSSPNAGDSSYSQTNTELDGAPSASNLGRVSNSWTSSSLRIETENAVRIARVKKLHPYQRDALKSFLTASPLAREVELYANQFELYNKMQTLVSDAPLFTVGKALMENIKSYSVGVLLSAKLEAYRGDTPKEYVIAIIKKERLNVPENFERDPYIMRVVGGVVGEELTQARALIKKAIAAGVDKDTPIYELATKVVEKTRCAVSVQLCARLALMRKMFLEDKSSTFWKSIDTHLQFIRSAASDDAKKVTKVFTRYLKEDRESYGDQTAYNLAQVESADVDGWQQSIDTLMDPK